MTDGFVHFGFIHGTHNYNAGILVIAVGFDKLVQVREDLIGPAEDDRMVGFNDSGMAFLQGRQLIGDAVRQKTDEHAENKDAAQRDDEHRRNKEDATRIPADEARSSER
jgi:hypothetical protein